MTTVFFISANALFLSSPSYSECDLNQEQTKQLFIGNTVFAYNVRKEFDIITYFSPDGTAHQKRDGDRRKGAWEIDKKGWLCIEWDYGKGSGCKPIVKDGERYKKYRVKSDGNRVYILKYDRFIKGNSENL